MGGEPMFRSRAFPPTPIISVVQISSVQVLHEPHPTVQPLYGRVTVTTFYSFPKVGSCTWREQMLEPVPAVNERG